MVDNTKEFSLEIVADILGTSKRVIESWSTTKLIPHINPNNGKKYFKLEQLFKFPSAEFSFVN